jgi:hypothetical protein
MAMFRRFSEDFIEIAATWSIWIAAADNNRTGFFNFGLTRSGLAQATLLFGAPDHYKAPRLKIVPIRRFQAGSQDHGQGLIGDR